MSVVNQLSADVVIIGGGVGGLSAALSLGGKRVIVLTKSRFGFGGSTPIAQGGIAAAMGADDNPELHAEDTMIAGDGLSVRSMVDLLTQEGPVQVNRLIELGAEFDRTDAGELSLGQEAAHSRRRILHAHGDSTGAEVQRALVKAVTKVENVQIIDCCSVSDLLVKEGEVVGAEGIWAGKALQVYANAVVLATGGIGRIYRYTTNALESTGDGIAMAYRAGAKLGDVEFVQFHPTALMASVDPMPLLTEALRGEGAVLLDERGERFMVGLHADAELAPRDVVARGLWGVQQRGGRCFLDARVIGEVFPNRFPTVFRLCQEVGLDPRESLLPVCPASHYHMGGVVVDAHGKTSLEGLWACGEVAMTGVHGANRLASNSLLEGLVFGARVSEAILGSSRQRSRGEVKAGVRDGMNNEIFEGDQEALHQLRDVMWEKVGLVRCEEGMSEALDFIESCLGNGKEKSVVLRNMLETAGVVTRAALLRKESRGGHYRSDYPNKVVL